jgi:microcystin-dependent protein
MSRVLDLLAGLPGVLFDYAGTVAPAGWLMCDGSAVSRTTYATLFGVIGTTYGAGDGATTFSLPDFRGRVAVGNDAMGGTASGRMSISMTGTTIAGSAVIGGLSSTANLSVGMGVFGATIPGSAVIASIDNANQVTLATGVGVTAGTNTPLRFGVLDGSTIGATGGVQAHKLVTSQMPSHTHDYAVVTNSGAAGVPGGTGYTMTTIQTGAKGGDQAHPNVQPSMVCNKIIKF